MQAVIMTLKGLPWSVNRCANGAMTGLQRLAVRAAIYRALRTVARPPWMERFP